MLLGKRGAGGKTIGGLCDVLVNPVLETSKLTRCDKRFFGAMKARIGLMMSHYEFNQRLLNVAWQLEGRSVVNNTGEPGTSKTCPNPGCGHWNANLKGAKLFCCPACGIEVDRDNVGARGNGLSALCLVHKIPPLNSEVADAQALIGELEADLDAFEADLAAEAAFEADIFE